MQIDKEWLIAIKWMLIELKQVMEESQEMITEDQYDEEFYLRKVNNIIDNFNEKIDGELRYE